MEAAAIADEFHAAGSDTGSGAAAIVAVVVVTVVSDLRKPSSRVRAARQASGAHAWMIRVYTSAYTLEHVQGHYQDQEDEDRCTTFVATSPSLRYPGRERSYSHRS